MSKEMTLLQTGNHKNEFFDMAKAGIRSGAIQSFSEQF
jgi:hypothetical protein